jgi:hypothetical protein
MWLVAYGFVYPTDSSINVAIGQGGRVKPRAVARSAGCPRPVGGCGAGPRFPAGKNKTILVDLDRVARGRSPARAACTCGQTSRSTGIRSRMLPP